MNKRIFITGTACALLLATAAFAVNGKETTVPADSAPVADTASAVQPDEPAAMPDEAIPYSIGVKAVVTDILRDGERVSLEVQPEDGQPIILNLSDATILLDAQQAVPVAVEDIRVGDTIYAYHSMMMTMSIPGQTPALVILTNLGDDEAVSVHLHMPEQVIDGGDSVSVLCDNGSIWVRTAEDTVFTPYRTRQIVTAADLRMGQPFLAWYDIVAESYPAQATANRVMILPVDSEERELHFVIDGDMVVSAKMEDGEVIVPARAAAEALGLKVGFRKEDGKGIVTVASDTAELSMALDEDAYSLRAQGAKDAETHSFGVAPHTVTGADGVPSTWMSAEAFRLLGYEVALEHETLRIEKP